MSLPLAHPERVEGSRPKPLDTRALLVWLLAALAATVLLGVYNVSRLASSFDADARTLHRVMSQRADQHDALLTSLAAVVGDAEGGGPALRPLTEAVLRFYPRIIAIEVIAPAPQPRVTFTTRELGTASQDPAALAALAATLQPGQATVLVEKERRDDGYALVKRVPIGAIVMTVDARRLAEADGRLDQGLTFKLAAPEGTPIARMRDDAKRGALPAFAFANELGSRSQPLVLTVRKQPTLAEVLPPFGVLLAVGGSGAAVLLGAILLRERRAAQEARERADFHAQSARFAHAARVNTVGEMASGIVHELTQPLTAILSQSQAGIRLARAQAAPGDIVEVLEANARGAKRAGDILARLRDYIANRTPEPGPTALNSLVSDVADLAKADLARRSVSLTLALAETGPQALVDRVSIEQVVHNLLVNAIDAVEALPAPRRTITVTTGAEGDDVFIAVHDRGEGIAPANLPRLFEPFFTTKGGGGEGSSGGGLGLGLPLCERLVERFGGTVTAGNHPGGGAIFTVRLPALKERA